LKLPKKHSELFAARMVETPALNRGCGAFLKMTHLQLWSSYFHEHGSSSSSGTHCFLWVWLRLQSSLFL